MGQVARDFDLTETAVRAWVKQAELDTGTRADGLASAEREELAALRAENVSATGNVKRAYELLEVWPARSARA